MTLRIIINLDNEAFTGNEQGEINGEEICRVLRQLTGPWTNYIFTVDTDHPELPLKDSNGNTCGTATFEE